MPSKISLRWPSVSTIEILNIAPPFRASAKSTARAKGESLTGFPQVAELRWEKEIVARRVSTTVEGDFRHLSSAATEKSLNPASETFVVPPACEWCANRARQESRRGSMPSFFMREISVVRLIPMRTAAPCGPATRPFASFRMRRMSSR